MKTALVIPTLNAVRRGRWPEVLAAIAAQDMQPDLKLVVDSESADQTRPLAEAYGWRTLGIRRRNFDHGATRSRILRLLAARGYDCVFFLSQDVVLTAPDTLRKLRDFLTRENVSGCFGKQINPHERSLNAWQRERCYPDADRIKTLADASELGLMTPFFSNAFAAWRIADALRCGGFPDAGFGEDMLLAAEVLRRGGRIGYCSGAVAMHAHRNTPKELWSRGFQIGRLHRRHPELMRQFGRPAAGNTLCGLSPALLLPLGLKAAGVAAGRFLPWPKGSPEKRQKNINS